ncbi:MAG: hypothetical protein M4579_000147 [Chaenotheca gracillima]|nr:MAG: hypothetical protein M4579_000147 [Chaenotheca gracillima]
MALPSPTLNFTIPSVHDDTILDCRIYHPASFSYSPNDLAEGRWRKKGAIVAHPYAPLGGSYDDPVVAAIAKEVRRTGYVVGTFNFRGAGYSKGRTSWTAKAEVADYVSFAAFFVHYLHHLEPPSGRNRPQPFCSASDGTLTTIPSSVVPLSPSAEGDEKLKISLIIGGYSYGALIAMNLPPIQALLAQFVGVEEGSSEAEIVLRAERLASQWNREAQAGIESGRGRSIGHLATRSVSNPVIVGGEESQPGVRHPSRESRRSMDSVRKSLDVIRSSPSQRRQASRRDSSRQGVEILGNAVPSAPDVSYLLVSPLLPPISAFATFFSDPSRVWGLSVKTSAVKARDKLAIHPTAVIWGTKDIFTSHKKLRKWAEDLAGQPLSKFRFLEILDAGHFFHEEGVEDQLKRYVRSWSHEIQ